MSTGRSSKQYEVAQVATDILSEFLEVAFHCILYVREIYPNTVFERCRKYNVPVQMCCHPDVKQYIVDVIQSLKPILDKQQVDKIALVILAADQNPVEKFVFDITPVSNPTLSEDTYLLRLEQALRAFLLKLNICDASLQVLPEDCTWAVQVHTENAALLGIEEQQILQEFPWIEADESQVKVENAKLVPLKAMTSPIMKMQLYIEEKSPKT
uniref:Mitotic spindle assembly checkpoint protein MAD2B n=1 Tax=Cerebratulus lacteus TaxID=6221 RepID=E2ICJ8_CERLA|nr:mitotic spindle assembly checkpoint protein [Cerebratulus lacteus]